jgi:hypothetical protein
MGPMRALIELIVAYLMAELVGLRKWASAQVRNWIRARESAQVLLPAVVASGVSTARAEPFNSEGIAEAITNVARSDHSAVESVEDDGGTLSLMLTPSTA